MHSTCIARSFPMFSAILFFPTLQPCPSSSCVPCSFRPQDLCTTSLNPHLVKILPVDSSPSATFFSVKYLLTLWPAMWVYGTELIHNTFLSWQVYISILFDDYLSLFRSCSSEFSADENWAFFFLTIYSPVLSMAPGRWQCDMWKWINEWMDQRMNVYPYYTVSVYITGLWLTLL